MSIDETTFTNDSMLEHVHKFHKVSPKLFSHSETQNVLVACSGGADSIALAIIMRAYDIDFALAYIDHGLHPETSECEVIVKNLSSCFDVPFFTTHLDMGDADSNSNIEATARSLRYAALEALRTTHMYQCVATAHHLDDVVETFLINLVRGAGSGIASLAPVRDHIVRPLLDWRKSELVALVESVGIEYYSDPMNNDPRFVRNRMRNEVIPLLSDIAQRDVAPLIARTAQHLQDDNDHLQSMASSIWPAGDPSTRSLMELDPVLRAHALRAWLSGYPPSSEEMDRILEVVSHKISSTQISGHRTIWRTGAVLYQDVTPPV